MRVLVVGRGRVGEGLARALRRTDGPGEVRTISARASAAPDPRRTRFNEDAGASAGRHARRAAVSRAARERLDRTLRTAVCRADVVVLAVSDRALPSLAARLARLLTLAPPARGFQRPRPVVLHCAGRLGPDALEPLQACGVHVGVLHPLVSFAVRGAAPPLAGTTFVVAGDPRALRAGADLARRCGARTLRAPLHGAAYHAAAALVAGSAAATGVAAAGLFAALGAPEHAARTAVAGLLRSVAHNLEHLGGPRILTGPIARGDAVAVAEHRAALARLTAAGGGPAVHAVRALYEATGPALLEVARAAGLAPRAAARIARALRTPIVDGVSTPNMHRVRLSAPPTGTRRR
jgi:predicted short-subunit dehydrogenase-like oxidoreductase (DUF2520 family)